jgi:SUKH-4 immunity protein
VSDGGVEFERSVFSGLPQVPEILALPASVRHCLLDEGVPKYFFYRNYSTDAALSAVRVGRHSPLVRFGAYSRGIVAVDTASGNVLHCSDVRQQAVSFVNSTLRKFTDTVRVLTESLPYGARDWFNDSGKAADAIEAIVYSIDAEAMAPDSYWPDYAKEVGGLMYGLDEIMEWQRARFSSSPPDDAETQGWGDEEDNRLF